MFDTKLAGISSITFDGTHLWVTDASPIPLLDKNIYEYSLTGTLLPAALQALRRARLCQSPGETKNDEGRTLPIYGEMLEWLKIEKEIRESKYPKCTYVFHENGETLRGWRGDWDEACVRAGVPGLLFHDLRRTAVRNMVRAGIPEKTAMAISGPKTRSIFDRYNIVNDRDLAEAAAKMELHLTGLGILSGILAPAATENHRPNSAQLLCNDGARGGT